MRTFVTGGSGMLGTDLVARLRDRREVFAPSHDALDLLDRDAVFDAHRHARPERVINCAAYTAVDAAEDDAEGARALNGTAVRHLAEACREVGAALCHVSTDYVFDGSGETPWRPEDPTGPLSEYGRSKRLGEQAVISTLKRFFIVRTSWLYGHGGRNFVEAILENAAAGNPLRVVDDQYGAPTWTGSLAGALDELTRRDRYGVYHFTDRADGGISWFDFAVEILRQAGWKAPVQAVPTSAFPRPAARPANSRLDCSGIEDAGILRRTWQEALADYLRIRSSGTEIRGPQP